MPGSVLTISASLIFPAVVLIKPRLRHVPNWHHPQQLTPWSIEIMGWPPIRNTLVPIDIENTMIRDLYFRFIEWMQCADLIVPENCGSRNRCKLVLPGVPKRRIFRSAEKSNRRSNLMSVFFRKLSRYLIYCAASPNYLSCTKKFEVKTNVVHSLV